MLPNANNLRNCTPAPVSSRYFRQLTLSNPVGALNSTPRFDFQQFDIENQRGVWADVLAGAGFAVGEP